MKPTRPVLPREFVAVRKRRRIMDAMAELSAEQGYEATKIADIVRRAGVARKTLYDNFDGKEEVFLGAFDSCHRRVPRQVEEACEAAGDEWIERVEAGLAPSYLRRRASGDGAHVPDRGDVGDTGRLGPLRRRRCSGSSSYSAQRARRTGLPDTIEETLVGGVAWILHQRIRRGGAEQALDLMPELSDFVLSPYHGVAKSSRNREAKVTVRWQTPMVNGATSPRTPRPFPEFVARNQRERLIAGLTEVALRGGVSENHCVTDRRTRCRLQE